MQNDTAASRTSLKHATQTTGLCVLLSLAGCAKDTTTTRTSSEPVSIGLLQPGDFARTQAEEPAQTTSSSAQPIRLTEAQARGGVADIRISIGEPETTPRESGARVAEPTVVTSEGEPAIPGPLGDAQERAAESDQVATGRTTAVDLMVGQVNGQPIYAQEFFTPLDTRLRVEADRLPRNQWLQLVTTEVDRILFERVRDQLLLDEFDQSLTADQRLGVAAFLERFRTRIVSGNLGSALLADEALQREEGLSLDEKVEREIDRQVILEQLRREVLRRVNVSFRDIERYYNRNIDQYQPAPTAVLRVIRVRLDDEETLTAVEDALSSQEDFVSVAAEHSSFRQSSEGKLEVRIDSRDLATTEFFGIESLNAATQSLEREGQSTDRVDTDRDAWWVLLEELIRPEGRTLYEMQNEIEETIRADRFRSAEREYFAELFGRSAVSDLDEMRAKLITFAVQTYLTDDPQRGG